MGRRLGGLDRESGLCAALHDAYASREDLEMMLGLSLERSLDDIVTSGPPLKFTIFQMIKVAKSAGWLDSLSRGRTRGPAGKQAAQSVGPKILAGRNLATRVRRQSSSYSILCTLT